MNIEQLNQYTLTSPDVMVKSTLTQLTYDGKNIIWANDEQYNNLSYVIDTVNKDYTDIDSKADSILLTYISGEIAPEIFLKEYNDLLSTIHPYLGTKQNTSIIPGHVLACYCVFNFLVRNYKVEHYSKIFSELTFDAAVSKFLKPITDKIYFSEQNSNIIIDYYKMIAKNGNVSDYSDYDLETLIDTIGIFRKVLCIYSNSGKVSPSKYNLFVKLFVRKIEKNVADSLKYVEASSNIMRKYSIIDYAELTEDASIDNYINEHMDTFANKTYCYYRFEQLIFLYLDLILENSIKIKRCPRCGKLFIAKNLNEKYCNYIIGDSDQTCRDVGTKEILRDKLKSSALYSKKNQIYQRFYSKKYSTHCMYEDKLFNIIELQYSKYQNLIIKDYEQGLIDEGEGIKIFEASYKEIKDFFNLQKKEVDDKLRDSNVPSDKEQELEQAIDEIMSKYIKHNT